MSPERAGASLAIFAIVDSDVARWGGLSLVSSMREESLFVEGRRPGQVESMGEPPKSLAAHAGWGAGAHSEFANKPVGAGELVDLCLVLGLARMSDFGERGQWLRC